jgi:CubicO group peptidase (beta-lactamase class C family)
MSRTPPNAAGPSADPGSPDLPGSAPQAQGVDPAAIDAMVRAWQAAGVRPFALRVIRHGVTVASRTWAPYRPEDRVLTYSLAKTFTASAVGLAVGEGLLTVADRVSDHFPEVAGIGPRASSLTIEHLLTMATGHTQDTYGRLDPQDLPGSFLRIEPETEPGSTFCYHNSAPLMLSAVLQRITGQPLHTYLLPRLLDPLGIGPVRWLRTGPYDQGFSGLHLTCDAVARLGLLLLGRGRFQGRQVLPEHWVTAATTVHITNGTDPTSDWAQGYGYQMWRSRHGWRGDGAFGQLCLVLPEHDLVVAVLAQGGDMQAELDAVWDQLLPGLHDAPLPGRSGTVLPSRPALPSLASSAAASLGRLELRATGPAAPGVAPSGRVVLTDGLLVVGDGADAVRVPLGDGHWQRADPTDHPVAGTGGWTAPGILDARVVPLHSPHVLLVHAEVDRGTVDLRWDPEPLGELSLTGSRWLPTAR